MDDHLLGHLRDGLAHRYERLEESRSLGVPLATTRRFFEIEGLDLGGLLALELFTTIIPLALLGFGWMSDFSPNLSFGDLLIRQLRLDGTLAQAVRDLFGSGASLESSWTVIGLASFLVWGIPMSSQVAKTFARAWRRERFPLLKEAFRGAAWFVMFLGAHVASLAITEGQVESFTDLLLNVVSLVPLFVMWSLTPAVLIRNGGVAPKHLMWSGVVGVVLDGIIIRWITRLLLPALMRGWIGFGPIGVTMAIMTWCTIVAALWVVTACMAAVIWERYAPADTVVSQQDTVHEPRRGSR
ncbi:MAG: hypothetical protein RLZ04_279 [Actinomycetota bacterium]